METKFNFKSQIATSREQSERLLALGLKKETTDVSWIFAYHWECFVGNPEELYTPDEDGCDDVYIPAWSLHRLLRLIAISLNISNGITIALPYDIPFDDCIERIEHLIKEGFFNKEYLV